MNRIKLLAMAVALLAPAAATLAAEQPLICFGNEPFWRLDLTTPGQARFSLHDGPATMYRGRETRIEPRREAVWRGRSAGKSDGELVAFLRDGACSDGMSDTVHPVSVNVSLPGGAHYAGCCRVPAAPAPAPARPIKPIAAASISLRISTHLHFERPCPLKMRRAAKGRKPGALYGPAGSVPG